MRGKSRLITVWLLGILLLALVLAGCGGDDETGGIPDPVDLPQESAEAFVYFATGRSLVEEKRVVDAERPYDDVLSELLEAQPERNKNIAIVQPQAKILSTALGDDGVFTIDWSADVLDFDAEDREKVIALAAVLRTMGQFEEVQKVRFTVEGKDEGELNGKDIADFWGRVSLNGQPWDVLRPQERTLDETTQPADGTGGETTETPTDESQ